MKVTHLDHWSISTSRLEETRAFFVDILGLEVGPRPKLKTTGYWLYAGGHSFVHLIEKGSGDPGGVGEDADKDGGSSRSVVESGLDDHIAFNVADSHTVVDYMKEKGIDYWDRLLPDRPLYQVFIKDPNGLIIELNDYAPALDKIEPMVVYDNL